MLTQDEDAGYTEKLCVVCENAFRSRVTHDNWEIHQMRNCETALADSIVQPAPEALSIHCENDPTLLTIVNDWQSFFTNPFEGECGPVISCMLR